jgi:hypothetical protein
MVGWYRTPLIVGLPVRYGQLLQSRNELLLLRHKFGDWPESLNLVSYWRLRLELYAMLFNEVTRVSA